jgi:hypothetical protein
MRRAGKTVGGDVVHFFFKASTTSLLLTRVLVSLIDATPQGKKFLIDFISRC